MFERGQKFGVKRAAPVNAFEQAGCEELDMRVIDGPGEIGGDISVCKDSLGAVVGLIHEGHADVHFDSMVGMVIVDLGDGEFGVDGMRQFVQLAVVVERRCDHEKFEIVERCDKIAAAHNTGDQAAEVSGYFARL